MKQDLRELSRRSILRDFSKAHFKRLGHAPKPAHPRNVKRVTALNKNCYYWQYRRFFVGKLVRLVGEALVGGIWVEFVRGDDRRQLNNSNGWPASKRRYLLQGAKFED